jgi:hypothetical protein
VLLVLEANGSFAYQLIMLLTDEHGVALKISLQLLGREKSNVADRLISAPEIQFQIYRKRVVCCSFFLEQGPVCFKVFIDIIYYS